MNQKQTVSLEIVLKGITTTDKEAVTAAKAHWTVWQSIKQLRRVRRGYMPHCRCEKAGKDFPLIKSVL